MRALGLFNIVYGLLGLISCAILTWVMPMPVMPTPMLVTGAMASAWIIAVGIALRIWGDVVSKILGRAKSAVWIFLKHPKQWRAKTLAGVAAIRDPARRACLLSSLDETLRRLRPSKRKTA
jgi:hypothetical protein